MPRLTIDGIAVEVPEGTNVLEAAKVVGVVIPHFCYHPALGAVGACRLCAMKFIEGPVKGVQVSCMVEAKDGMVVSTTDGEAARLRRMVIEWLMLNHPHDCPVCDEGGMCLLQDYTVSGGHGRRRYKGKKRAFPDQYLGEFIKQEMNRCIQCYRCARFYQDYAGGEDFGPMQIANKTYFGRHREGWLDSEFSGNLAEVCPTGVFTDRTYRFKARAWDLERGPSVCPHCSLGCNTMPGARYRALLRVEARENLKVNGWFICDRGRFGYGYANRPDRPRNPRVDGRDESFSDAYELAARRISHAISEHGPGSVAFLGSPRASIETNYSLMKFAQALGSPNICFSPDPARERKVRRAAARLLPGTARSLRGVEFSDLIITAGADPLNEAPMLALMMRQAARKGAHIVVIDPRPVSLPFKFTHIPCAPEGLAEATKAALGKNVAGAKSPTIIVGTDVGDEALIDTAAESASRLRQEGLDAGVFYIMSGPNSFGTALLAGNGPDFGDVLDGIIKGRIRTLITVESDPVGLCPDGDMIEEALGKLENLIAIDYLPSSTAKRADVQLPCTAAAETDGVYVNNEGRAQAFSKVYTAGTPINDMGPDAHPPRTFTQAVTGNAPPAWRHLEEIRGIITLGFQGHTDVHGIREEIAALGPGWEALTGLDPEGEGVVINLRAGYLPPDPTTVVDAGGGFALVATELTFGTEEISTYADKAQLKAQQPYVTINSDDAARIGILHGGEGLVRSGDKVYAAEFRVSEIVAKGVAVAPRIPGWPVAGLAGKRVNITRV